MVKECAVTWLGLSAAKVSSAIQAFDRCPHESQQSSGSEHRQLCRTCLNVATQLWRVSCGLQEGLWPIGDQEFQNQVYCLLGTLEDMCLVWLYSALKCQMGSPLSLLRNRLTSFGHQFPSKLNPLSSEHSEKQRFPILRRLIEEEERNAVDQHQASCGSDRKARQHELLRGRLHNFLSNSPQGVLDVLDEMCQDILDRLQTDDKQYIETVNHEDHSVAREALFPILAKYSRCNSCVSRDDKDTCLWHPTRLFLMNWTTSKDGLVRFDIFTSSVIDSSWQDLCIGIPASAGRSVTITNNNEPSGVTNQPSRDLNSADYDLLGGFCEIFQDGDVTRTCLRLQDEDLLWLDPEPAKHQASPGKGISLSDVLNRYSLNVQEKLALAHTIALAFWQFYDSPLMHRVWSSDTIWFMPEPDSQDNSQQLPLKSYVSFHPDAIDPEPDALEFIERFEIRRLLHRCPRILSLGILLLEIGLGKPLGHCRFQSSVHHTRQKQLNSRFSIASQYLRTLEESTWEEDLTREHLLYKKVFTKAVGKCLNADGLMGKEISPDNPNSHFSRRELLHQEVVSLLAWLNKRVQAADYLSIKQVASGLSSDSHHPINECVPPAAGMKPEPEPEQASMNGSRHANYAQPRELSCPSGRRDFEIAIICALTLEADAVEADAVEALFDHRWSDDIPCYDKSRGDYNTYSLGSFGPHNIVLIYMPGMGKSNAASAASNCRRTFSNIKLAIVVGICGVVPSAGRDEIVLGDIVVSDGIIQYDLGRQFPKRFVPKDTLLDSYGRPNIEIRGFLQKLKGIEGGRELQRRTSDYLKFLQQRPKLEAYYPKTQDDILFEAAYEHLDEKLTCQEAKCSGRHIPRRRLVEDTPEPTVHFGLFASGDTVMKSGNHRDKIAQRDGVLGFEMEGAGVWDIFPCVIIKGACDYADSHKTKAFQSPDPENDTEDAARECPDYAAAATLDQLRGSEDYVVFVCATLGEFDDKNPDNHVVLNKGTDTTCNVTLQYTLSDRDRALWDVMDEATYDTIRAMSGGHNIEYWDEVTDKWIKGTPATDTIRVPGIVHEASTYFVGLKEVGGSLDELYCPHGVGNVFVTGAALFPTAGSWNPTLTMCEYAQDLAHKLHDMKVKESACSK